MENQLLDLHDKEYMDRLLSQESDRLARLQKFIEVRNDFTIADFGCGNAPMLDVLGQKVGSYYGVDFSSAAIENAETRKDNSGFSNAHFNCGSVQTFCEENPGRFDAGFAMDFSEHVYDKEWTEILTSIKHSLKKGAKLYLHTPNGNYFLEIMKSKNFIVKQFPEHVAVRNARENTILLERAGYKINNVIFVPHYNILKTLHGFSYIPWIGSYFQARLLIIAENF
jgi:cyclopropane fatty-acyl-phospholipid synthase-like methyltransferase